VGNGLTPSTNYGETDGPSLAAATPGLYEINRKSVYSHPDESQNKTTLLTFNLQHAVDANTELATTAYVRYGKQKRLGGDVEWNDVDGEQEGELRRSNTSQNSFGLSANLTKILGNHQLTSGASIDQSKSTYGANVQEECHINEATREVTAKDCDPAADTAGVKGTASSLGLFLSDTFKVSDTTFLTVGGRYNQTTVKNTLTSFKEIVDGNLEFRASPLVKPEEKSTFRKFNPSFGLSHKLNDNTTLFGNWSQSNRAPTVIELGCADENEPCQLPTGLQADPVLEQVVAQTTEAGLRWKNNQNYSLAVTAYQTNNKNDILFLRSKSVKAVGYGYFENFAKTQYQGVDISASKSWGTVRMSTAYSYLKATYQATADLLAGEREMVITPGMRLPGLPKNTLKLNVDWQTTNNLNLGAGLQYSSSIVTQGNEDGIIGEDEDADTPVRGDLSIKGFALLNLKATYQAAKGLTVFGKINNALNKRYETYGMVGHNNFTPTGGPIASGDEPTIAKFVAPGATRSLMVGLRYKF
jgi:outer membrane receptor protein involved in Fe transport